MAFGLKYIEGADQEKNKLWEKLAKEEGDVDNLNESTSSKPKSSPSSPSRFARRSAEPSSSPQTKKSIKDEKTSYDSLKKSYHDTNQEVNDRFDELIEDSEAVIEKEARSEKFKKEKIAMRARRLAQDVAEFKKYSLDELHALEKRAVASPRQMIEQLKGVYEKEILPAKKNSFTSFKEKINQNPDKIVFLLRKGRASKISFVDPNENPSQKLLNGCVLESVFASSTPFPSPSKIPELSQAKKSDKKPGPENNKNITAKKPSPK